MEALALALRAAQGDELMRKVLVLEVMRDFRGEEAAITQAVKLSRKMDMSMPVKLTIALFNARDDKELKNKLICKAGRDFPGIKNRREIIKAVRAANLLRRCETPRSSAIPVEKLGSNGRTVRKLPKGNGSKPPSPSSLGTAKDN